ncbi:MAG TPA: hypothetical protein VMA13_01720 [Candidatus Saccharimonadales bacterium]|nr:hypothetical protein [Candidatus Saccharimonadales bacterium]
MLATTIEIIRSGLKSDPSLSAADRARILAAIRNGPNTTKIDPATSSEPRLVRRAEAARRLGCSLRLVDRLAKDGVLLKRRLPNRKRAAGFLESDLNALISSDPVSDNNKRETL